MSPVRFVALGDSLTEGVGDPTGDGWRGWAALLADGLGAGRRPLARRQQAVNTVVHALSERYGAVHLHAAEGAWVTDRAL